jgi:hypothetical protein
MGHYTQAFGLHMVLAPVDGVGGCGCGLWREHPRVHTVYFPDQRWCVPKCRADPYSMGMLSSLWAA